MTEERKLHAKLAQVMYEAERIPKNGRAPEAMGGFRFVQVGDAADYIRKALAEKVISMLPSAIDVVGENTRQTSSGATFTTVELRITWTLTDGETGETATIQSYGAGGDSGDKYSGKATTNAMKYALLAGFLLSTGEDSELSAAPEPRRSTAQAGPPSDGGSDRLATQEPPRVPAAPTNGALREGDVHQDGHRPLRARASGQLYCPTKLPNGTWCSWRSDAPRPAVVASEASDGMVDLMSDDLPF